MKKINAILFATAVAAFAFVSCQKETSVTVSSESSEKTVHFTATSIETKTAFTTPSGTSYPTLWTANDETVKILQNTGGTPVNASVTPNPGYASAKFTASLTSDGSGSYTFYAFSPASAFTSYYKSYFDWNITVPSTQTPLAGSVDESAQLIAAQSIAYSPSFPTSVALSFTHVTAYGKISFTNLDTEAGETVSSVKLTAAENWVGTWRYYIADYSTFSAGDWDATATASKELNIITNTDTDIWFACAPVDLAGKTIDVLVTTNKATYAKTITIPAGKAFAPGKIASFTVDMSTAVKDVAPVYSLIPATGGTNGYATVSEDLAIGGINWNVMGNTTINPWRIGGKGTSVDRYLYSENPISANVNKIIITHGAAADITINSMTVKVYSSAADAADDKNPIATLTPTFAANDDVVVNKADATSWANGYYRINYNFTNTAGSNKYLEFKGAKFYN